jgi:protein TonB
MAPARPASAPGASLPAEYRALLAERLRRNLRYPAAARDNGHEGEVLVAFSIARDGTLRRAEVMRGSGVAAFDAEAMALLRRVAPLPPLPPHWGAEEAAFVAPIRFALR